MNVVNDDVWLCTDCTIAAVNDDYTSLDYHYGAKADERMAEIKAGLDKLGPHLVSNDSPDDDGEGHECFSTRHCDCCGEWRAGERHRFAALAP